MSRKLAREIAFKVIFSTNFGPNEESIKELINILIKENDTLDDVSKEDEKYIESVTLGVVNNIEKLDDTISNHLKGWKMDRIGKTDLAILRLAIYEILYRDDIPYKVSINEAVELAKLFCDETSPAFINGVLAGVVNNVEENSNK